MQIVSRFSRSLSATAIASLALVSSGEVQSLVNGQRIAVADQEELGLVEVGSCSGALITNRVVVSAAHCMRAYIGHPSNLQVKAQWPTQAGGSPQSRKAVRIVPFRSPENPSPGDPPDVAVIILNAPIAVKGTWRGFRRTVWAEVPYRDYDLNGRNIEVYGKGPYEFANPATGAVTHADDKYRVGRAVTSGAYDRGYSLNMVGGAQIGGGDSGGPSFVNMPRGRVLTGVHSNCSQWRLVPGKPMDEMWSWVTTSGGCTDASLTAVWDKVQGVIAEAMSLPIDPHEGPEPIPPIYSATLPNRRAPDPAVRVPDPTGPANIPNPHPERVPDPSVSSNSNLPRKSGAASSIRSALGTPSAATSSAPLCKPGFVFRAARADDLVCVKPESRERVADENRTAAERSLPGGGCRPGFVWRDAFNGDGVCVDPKIRDLVHAENRAGPTLRAR